MYNLIITEKYKNITIIHHIDNEGNLWGSSGRKIKKKSNDSDWFDVGKFPFSIPKDFFSFSRPTTRAMRADKCNLYVNKQGFILGIRGGKVYQIIPNKKLNYLFSINGDSVLHCSICEDSEGNMYFGEYYMNPNRMPVTIWKISSRIDSWCPAHTFPQNSVRHIHGIYPDPYKKNTFWVTTGDFEQECYLLKTEDGFKTFEQYGDGSQIWRAVKLFFTESHICWLTDSNLTQNYACRMRRDSGEIELGQKINASAWYGCQTSDGLFIAFTTVEPGPGIFTKKSEILISNDGFKWESIYSFKKDFLRPMKVFKYGVISCPSGKMDSENFYISGEGLTRLDGISLKISITQK